MIEYIIGNVTYIKKDYIVLETGGIGYKIYVGSCNDFVLGHKSNVYVYQDIKENSNFLYGFISVLDKDLFNSLLKIKGVGAKIALNILARYSYQEFQHIIFLGEIDKLISINKVNENLANNIINYFSKPNVNNKTFRDIISVLKKVGYDDKKIGKCLKVVDTDLDVSSNLDIILNNHN